MLSELHAIVRQIVVAACEDTLSQHGFVPDPLEDPADGNKPVATTLFRVWPLAGIQLPVSVTTQYLWS